VAMLAMWSQHLLEYLMLSVFLFSHDGVPVMDLNV
jgi:hypothetical protein